MEGDEQCGSAHSKRPKCEWQPPVWRRVVCRSQQTSSRQHKNSLLSGVMGAFRLHSEKRLDHLRTHREHSVKFTPCLCLSGNGTGTAGIVTKIPQPCQACSSNVAYPPACTPRNPVLTVSLSKRGRGGGGRSLLFCKVAVRLQRETCVCLRKIPGGCDTQHTH